MINIFFIEAPFQLLSAIESSKELGDASKILVVRKNASERNNQQIKEILDLNKDKWNLILFIDAREKIKTFLKLIVLRVYIFFRYHSLNVVAIGDYRSKFLRFFYPWFLGKKLWLLDDGIGLITLCKYTNQRVVVDTACLSLDSFTIGSQYLASSSSSGVIELKTFLNIEASLPFSVSSVNLVSVFGRMISKSQVVDDSLVFFIGAKVEEDGLLSRSEYLSLCLRAKSFFKDKEIIYFPHRDEFDSSIKEIQYVCDFHIVRPDMPIEFYVCAQERVASAIVSLFSSAMFTLGDLYPSIDLYAMTFDYSHLSPETKSSLHLCYRYLEDFKSAKML